MDDLYGDTRDIDDENYSYDFMEFPKETNSGFALKNIDVKTYISKDHLISLASSEECFFMATRKNKVIRQKVNVPDDYEVLYIPPKVKSTVQKIYTDPIGYHCILVMFKGDHCYLSLERNDIVILKKIKNLEITAVAFYSFTYPRSTNEILLGCKDGSIYSYELEINSEDEVVESALNKVFQIPSRDPIYGLVYDIFDYCEPDSKTPKRIALAMAVTNDTCYQFTGVLPFDKLFTRYNSLVEVNKCKKEVPKGKIDESELKLYYFYRDKRLFELRSFAWKCGSGIYYGKFRKKDEINESVTVKEFFVEPYRCSTETGTEIKIPESVAITECNLYLLYSNNLTVMSRATKKIEYSFNFRQNEVMNYIVHDSSSKSMWICSAKSVNRLMIIQENKDLWKLHLERGDFKEALKLCEDDNEKYAKYVAGLYADHEFKEGKYEKAAMLYVKSNRSFEEVILKYITAEENKGLVCYLKEQLKLIKDDKCMNIQRLLICTWIIEISISELKQNEIITMSELPENVTREEAEERDRQVKNYKETLNSFQDFLLEYKADLESETVFSMLKAHARFDDYLFFASNNNNYEAMIIYYINNRMYHQAINILINIEDKGTRHLLMIRYGSIFMKQIPRETIQVLSEYFSNMDIERLLPAFMSIEGNNRSLAIEYIRELKIGSSSKMLNNLYAFFLAQSDSKEYVEELSDFIEQQERLIKSNQQIHIDREFILSLCKYYNKVNAQIKVYGMFKLYEEAVHLALDVGELELAKEYANKPSDYKLKKKLWLNVARKTLKNHSETDQSIPDQSIPKVLNESTVLTIGDLLPYISPKMTLSTFQTELNTSLENYGSKIKELKDKMEGFSKCSENINNQLQETKNTSIPIAGEQCCEKCKIPLLGNEHVFIFPCTHGFHRVFPLYS